LNEIVLELKGISKHFPGIKALDGVKLTLRRGEVHALIGENGAGKSTLVKILTGNYIPSSGSITLEGKEVVFHNALDAQAAGITAIHQEATMFFELSVAENIFMGHHLKKTGTGTLDWKSMKIKTAELLKRMELSINPDTKVKDLSVAQRHMVEIAKALSIDAQVVIMDEPTSALSGHEVEDLFRIVRQLQKENKAILFISHKFDEIYQICDYFTVFRDGKYIGEGNISEYNIDSIINMMVGRNLDQLFPKEKVAIGELVFEAERLKHAGFFRNISFTLRKGEIVGFFGLVGAGRSELMRSIFGIDPLDEGEIRYRKESYVPVNPKHAMERGIAFVPEDRQTQGVILELSLRQNITLPLVDKISSLGLVNRKKEQEITELFGKKMNIKSGGWDKWANTLSGGNQQKVVLAKWLATGPEILILDEPTKGIDVGTKAAVHQLISEMAGKGLAVILVSSELPEIMGMADRVVVMHEGEKTAEFITSEVSAEEIMKAATGQVVIRGIQA
jgi:rhamnose transport system ATP-binding protein